MEIDPKLQEFLSKFKRLEDFRIDVSGAFCLGSARSLGASGRSRLCIHALMFALLGSDG